MLMFLWEYDGPCAICSFSLPISSRRFSGSLGAEVYALLSPKLPWRVRQAEFNKAFPPESSDIVVVVDGQTPELSEAAAAKLAASLGAQTRLFDSVQRPDGGPFWAHNGLLFASTADVKTFIAQLGKGQPFLGAMASDPSLRGLANTLALAAKGVNNGDASPADLRTPLRTLADALQGLSAGRPTFFSWRTLISGKEPDKSDLRRIILVGQPGLRLSLFFPAGRAALASAAIVLMLWFAVRTPWLIASILATTLVGLLTATALGLVLFQRFNVISVAFIPLFVGMGMDLGIQFSVRYRAERGTGQEVGPALIETGRTMGRSLTLAAAAIGAGFLAYRNSA